MIPEVNAYLTDGCGRCKLYTTPECKVHYWQQELKLLRSFIIECGLTEVLKWSMPCYTHNNKNILILSAFKEYCSINFFKGALITDTHNMLVSAGENSQSARQLRFTNIEDIVTNEDVIKAYIFHAIEIEKSGAKIELKKTEDYDVPEELEEAFAQNTNLKKAFYALTPGRQRGYLLFFAAPKQSKTREARIKKYMEHIFNGKGYQDR